MPGVVPLGQVKLETIHQSEEGMLVCGVELGGRADEAASRCPGRGGGGDAWVLGPILQSGAAAAALVPARRVLDVAVETDCVMVELGRPCWGRPCGVASPHAAGARACLVHGLGCHGS